MKETIIMVVDDDTVIKTSILEVLQRRGYKTLSASSGEEALEVLVHSKPDVILCDIMMPVMNGFTLLEHVRSQPLISTIPFIFMSALSDRRDIRLGMNSGADDYITKPFHNDELCKAIETRLARDKEQKIHLEIQLRELRQQMQTTAYHEIATPFNSIFLGLEILLNDVDTMASEERRQFLLLVQDSCKRLERMLYNHRLHAELLVIQNKNYPENECPEPAKIICSVANVIAEVSERPLDICISIPDKFPALAISEADFKIILRELIDNAFKFSNHHTPVTINAMVDSVTSSVTISIADNGRGIKPEHIPLIGPFVQFEREIYEQQGSGLGLSIAQRLTELNKGTFSVISKYGEGTTVSFALPLYQ